MSAARRELWVAVLMCLAGSALVLLAVGHSWGDVPGPSSLTIKDVRTGIPGSKVAGDVRALGVLGLAAVVAIAATRRTGRVVVGAIVAVSGVVVVVRVVDLLSGDLSTRLGAEQAGCRGLCVLSKEQLDARTQLVWPWLTVLGGVLLALAGLLVAVRGRRWAALSSAYESPVGRSAAVGVAEEVTDKGVWDALDRGDDPTA